MKKILFAAIVFLCFSALAKAQDVITRTDGTDIKAKVTDILPDVVKYKKFNYLDGPVFTIRKSDILIIRYENGTNEVFAGQSSAAASQPQRPQSVQPVALPDARKFSEGVTVISGDPGVLRKSAKGYAAFDYSQTIVGGKPLAQFLHDNGPEYERDWPKESDSANQYFPNYYGKKFKGGLNMQKQEAGADYILTLHIQDLDLGFTGGNFVPFANKAGGAVITGILEVREAKTGATALVIAFNNIKSVPAYTQEQRLGWAYNELVKKLAKLK